jgi:hypothetical protein
MFDDLFVQLNSWIDSLDDFILDAQDSNTEDACLQLPDSLPSEQIAVEDPYAYAPELTTPTESDQFNSFEFNGYGNPVQDAHYWKQQQGDNSCAVVAQLSIYEAITGQDISEAEACEIAQANGWFDQQMGTNPQDVGKLLNALGIPTTQSYDASLSDIAKGLEQGDKIIVGLDASEIWSPAKDPSTGQPLEQSNAGHAVWVTGIEQAADGSINLILNDSGSPNGQMATVSAEDFLNAWQDYGNFLVIADAPAVSA